MSVVECHGSIHHLQCLRACSTSIWPAHDFHPRIDEERCLILDEIPTCPDCQAIARPNILMFGDWSWIDERTQLQFARLSAWRKTVKRSVMIEIGAGSAIPSVREFGEELHCPIIRINPNEPDVLSPEDVGICTGALAGIRGIWAALNGHRQSLTSQD